MVTAVDTSVLLDVLLNDPRHSGSSIAALRQAANEDSLVICETALAEIVPTLAPPDVPQFPSVGWAG
jgi:predicted nucleic acid-binding protein